ncbi:hypothetical protein U1Q18_008104 [Sarracenia purpurea var. burkii]
MATIESMTPAKTLEAANIASTHSISPLGLGSDLFSVSGTARRQNLRLASIRSVGEITPCVAVSTRKRKSVVFESRMNRKNECLPPDPTGGEGFSSGVEEERRLSFSGFSLIFFIGFSLDLHVHFFLEWRVRFGCSIIFDL